MPDPTPISIDSSPTAHEETYVHGIYEEIATHFSQTRYKPWPLVAEFLASIEAGSIGLDSGTGNGKYLPLDKDGKIHFIGLDRSKNLLQFAKRAGGKNRDVVLGDALGLGWRAGIFDFAISIATIHHFSTMERRCEAIEALIFALSPAGGRFLVYVWAIEQDHLSRRMVPNPDSATTDGQDVLIPWVLTNHPCPSNSAPATATEPIPHTSEPKVFQRYYHMFAPSELRDLVCLAASRLNLQVGPPPSENGRSVLFTTRGLEIVREGWERSNYYLEARLWQS